MRTDKYTCDSTVTCCPHLLFLNICCLKKKKKLHPQFIKSLQTSEGTYAGKSAPCDLRSVMPVRSAITHDSVLFTFIKSCVNNSRLLQSNPTQYCTHLTSLV